MTEVNIYEAKSRLSHLLKLVANGEEVIISNAGRPVARLVPFVCAPPRVSGRLEGQAQIDARFFDPLPDDIQAYFE
jgi:prevent-host-death family protein